jgi:hypothetical protein
MGGGRVGGVGREGMGRRGRENQETTANQNNNKKTHRALDAPRRVVGVEQRVGLGVHHVGVLGSQGARAGKAAADRPEAPSSSAAAARVAAAASSSPHISRAAAAASPRPGGRPRPLRPGQRPVAAPAREAVVTDAEDHLPPVDDAGADLLARVFAPLRGQERDGHEVVVPAEVPSARGRVEGVSGGGRWRRRRPEEGGRRGRRLLEEGRAPGGGGQGGGNRGGGGGLGGGLGGRDGRLFRAAGGGRDGVGIFVAACRFFGGVGVGGGVGGGGGSQRSRR